MRTAALIAGALLAACGIASCSSPAPTQVTQCGSQRVGREGGVVTSPSGASVSIPPGALPAPIDISVCVVEVGHVPRQHSPMIEFAPTSLTVSASFQITMPIDAMAPPSLVAELRSTPSDPSTAVFFTIPSGPGLVTFTTSRLGDVRIMEADVLDGGFGDDGSFGDDVNRPDAPRPIGPVVVGPDLTPAAYACLGTVPLPTAASPMPVTLHAIDWADRSTRSDYILHSFPTPLWSMPTGCMPDPGCSEGTTDASGDATLMLTSGALWVSTMSIVPTDPSHAAASSWTAALTVSATTTRLDVPVLSQRTQQALVNSVTRGTAFVLGQVRDCDDAVVQRVRVRVFDSDSNTELVQSVFGGPPIVYGNGVGFPAGTGDRTAIDGIYLAIPLQTGSGRMRVEAWGRLVLGGEDVLLACDDASFESGQPILLDLRPLRAGGAGACGSVP